MILVVSHAQPAELIPALTACHMHAPLVLLNLDLTLGAWLCIELQPYIVIVAALIDLVEPSLKLITGNRPMSTSQALETPVLATLANYICLLHGLVLECKVATFSRAPFSPFVDVNV